MDATEQTRTNQAPAARYPNVDGSLELSLGALFLGGAFMTWLHTTSTDGTFWTGPWGFVTSVLLLMTVVEHLPRLIRSRITYRRSGYSDYRRTARRRKPLHSLVLAAAAVAAGLCLCHHFSLAALIGTLFIPVYAYGVARASSWKWLTAAALAAGCLTLSLLSDDLLASLAPSPLQTYRGLFASWLLEALWFGSTLALSGLTTLYFFLKKTYPLPEPGQ